MTRDPMTAPLPKVFSTSQITTYTNCPRRYCYDYVLRIPTLVKSEALEAGSRVHDAIAMGTDLTDRDEQAMVARARRTLATYPARPILESTFEDRHNPGRLYGDIDGDRFVGVFDVHWTEPAIAVDWKTGTYREQYTTAHETQAYVMGELYRETYGTDLDAMAFVFLKTGDVHYAKALAAGRSRTAAAERVARALGGIRARAFDKRQGVLCRYCDHQGVCRLGVGFA